MKFIISESDLFQNAFSLQKEWSLFFISQGNSMLVSLLTFYVRSWMFQWHFCNLYSMVMFSLFHMQLSLLYFHNRWGSQIKKKCPQFPGQMKCHLCSEFLLQQKVKIATCVAEESWKIQTFSTGTCLGLSWIV